MMKSLRCSNCSTWWPPEPEHYGACPQCHGKTWDSTADPMDADEARSLRLHLEFDLFCSRRDAERLKALESIPAMEAKR